MNSRSDRRRASDGDDDVEPVMTIGHNKGVPLNQIPDDELRRTRDWCKEKDEEQNTDRFKALIEAIDEELEERQGLPLFDD